ncbi:MAG: hypothetical protein ACQEQG_08545 [Bacillota bacterium]
MRFTKNILILVLVIFFLVGTASLQAEDDLELATASLNARINLVNFMVPRFDLEFQKDYFGILFGYSSFPINYEGREITVGLKHFGGRIYSPISYNDIDFYLGGGMNFASFAHEGVTVGIRSPQLTLGFERESNNIIFGGAIGYLHMPPEEIPSTFTLGFNIGYKFNFKIDPGSYESQSSISLSEEELKELEERKAYYADISSIRASGSIDSTSLPTSVSGSWNFRGDLDKNSGRISVSGDSGQGSFSYSGSGSLSTSSGGVVLTVKETFTDNGLNVEGTGKFKIGPENFQASVSLKRADGVSASGSIRGSTSTYSEK